MSFVAGASASIKKTIKEIEAILEGEELIPEGPKREALRQKLQEALIKRSKSWYKKGFKRGHKESHKKYEASGKFPKSIKYNAEREFIKNSKTKTTLNSSIK